MHVRLVLFAGAMTIATGCGQAVEERSPASFRDPAAVMSNALRSRRQNAPSPAFVSPSAAESLDDVRFLGAGDARVLVDLRRESGDDTHPVCGPLEVWDTANGRRLWSLERAPHCGDTILTTAPSSIVVLGRTDANKPTPSLTRIAADTGAILGRVDMPTSGRAFEAGPSAIAVVDGAPKRARLSFHEGDALAATWSTTIEDAGAATHVARLGDTLLAFGASVHAVDCASGKVLRSTPLGPSAVVTDLFTGVDGVYAVVLVRDRKERVITKIAADGAIVWSRRTNATLDAVTASHVLTVSGEELTALSVADGSVAWTGKLPSPSSGSGVVVPPATSTPSAITPVWVLPHRRGVHAVDAASGAVRFDVSPFGKATTDGAVDHLSVAEDGLVIADGARGVAGIEIGQEGHARYVIAVRSLEHVQRGARLEATKSTNPLGGVSSIRERRLQQARIAFRQDALNDRSPFVVRPISWSTGRGVLLVRKSDGAFKEIILGPPDVYEDPYRPASLASFSSGTSMLVSLAEGVDSSAWQLSTTRVPAQLVARRLTGYRVDVSSLAPASEYAARSIVPLGSFEE